MLHTARIRFGGQRLARSVALAVLTTSVLVAASSCKKKTPPPAPQAAVSTPGINTTGGAFDPVSWVQRKAATDQNVSVGAGNSHAHVTYAAAVKTINLRKTSMIKPHNTD